MHVDLADEEKSLLIAKKVAMWHRIEVPGEPSPRLFRTLRKWFSGVPKSYKDPRIDLQFQQGVDMGYFGEELDILEEKVQLLGSATVFCHNDILAANIIYQPATAGGASKEADVSFIDFEYGAQNYRGFDIANHFCEYAGFECEFKDYPKKEAQLRWLHAYLTAFKGSEPGDIELESLYVEVNFFTLVSNPFCSMSLNTFRHLICFGAFGH